MADIVAAIVADRIAEGLAQVAGHDLAVLDIAALLGEAMSRLENMQFGQHLPSAAEQET